MNKTNKVKDYFNLSPFLVNLMEHILAKLNFVPMDAVF